MTYDDDEKPMVGSSYRPKSRRCCIVSMLSVSLALLLILAVAIPVGMNNAKKRDNNGGVNPACDATSYPERCREEMKASDGTYEGMSKMGLMSSDTNLENLQNTTSNPDCHDLLEQARESIREVFNETVYGTSDSRLLACDDMQTKLSAAIEQVDTCQNILSELQAPEFHAYPIAAQNATQILSIVLAITNAFCKFGGDISKWKDTFNLPDDFDFNFNFNGQPPPSPGGQRRLLHVEDFEGTSEGSFEETVFPSWMDSATSRHLLGRPPSYNVIVAKDGSGRYKTVMDAINNAPKSGKYNAKRYVIYVKAGVYNEQIIIPKKLTNLMIIGDGIDRTIFTGSRSVMLTKGMTTFASGTILISGATGFIGKYFTVRNTAGSAGHQAVACRVSGDLTAFYRVKFDSFQDTLYAHTFRQFYSQCIVQGTVDFLFGNGNAVFQNCQIIAKKSQLLGQQNTYTAQGRIDPHQNTGLAFQDCNFDATADLKRNVALYPTFMGRPWKAYSVCVLLRPTLQGHIDPKGWLPWNTTNFGLYTSFFAEYKGKGPGSNTRNRVKWSHQITNPKTANRYQAASFIQGKSWLPYLGIAYSLVSV